MCQQDLRDGVPNCHQRASQGRWHTARFAGPCLALLSYPLYKSSRAAKISGNRDTCPHISGTGPHKQGMSILRLMIRVVAEVEAAGFRSRPNPPPARTPQRQKVDALPGRQFEEFAGFSFEIATGNDKAKKIVRLSHCAPYSELFTQPRKLLIAFVIPAFRSS